MIYRYCSGFAQCLEILKGEIRPFLPNSLTTTGWSIGFARCALSLRKPLKARLKPCSGFAQCLEILKGEIRPF